MDDRMGSTGERLGRWLWEALIGCVSLGAAFGAAPYIDPRLYALGAEHGDAVGREPDFTG